MSSMNRKNILRSIVASSIIILLREMQENYYLILFMFANQLYFYVLGLNSLLCY